MMAIIGVVFSTGFAMNCTVAQAKDFKTKYSFSIMMRLLVSW